MLYSQGVYFQDKTKAVVYASPRVHVYTLKQFTFRLARGFDFVGKKDIHIHTTDSGVWNAIFTSYITI